MPFIGVTVSKVFSNGRWRHQCPADYIQAVLAAGGTPLLLPSETILADCPAIVAKVSGVLLSGGGDLDPALFGQERHEATGEPDAARDEAELALVPRAVEGGRPVLAICRGIQALNVALGGDLVQDLPSAGLPGHEQSEPGTVRTHPVVPIPGTVLAELMPATFMVNSFHHQAVGCLGRGLVVAARSPDGVVEAVQMPGRPVIGVQYHPEMYAHLSPEAARLFDWLVRAAASAGPD